MKKESQEVEGGEINEEDYIPVERKAEIGRRGRVHSLGSFVLSGAACT